MKNMLYGIINIEQHDIRSQEFIEQCKEDLSANSVIILPHFLQNHALKSVVQEATANRHKAYYASSCHNVYLTKNDPSLPVNHAYNRQITSSKGCIQFDQIPKNSLLKTIYHDPIFQSFLEQVLGIEKLHPYADPLSSINIHYASEGQNLGWHFDNSAFAVTLLLQEPDAGGVFEYVPNVRNSNLQEMGFDTVESILDGKLDPKTLGESFGAGSLVLFRGRDSLHRVTTVRSGTTRMLVGLAYNDKPGVELSKEARMTFFGRTGNHVD
eukprot:50321_1